MGNLPLAVGLAIILDIWVMFAVLLVFLAYFIACELHDLFK